MLLLGFGVYQYFQLQRDLVNTRVTTLQADVTYAETAASRTLSENGVRTVRSVCALASAGGTAGNAAFRTFATALVATTGRTAQVVVYNRSLEPAVTVPRGSQPPSLDSADLAAALAGRGGGHQLVDTSDGTDLVAAFPVQAASHTGGVCGAVQVSVSMQPITEVLDRSRTQLLLGGLATLAVALVLGLLATSRALRPLSRLQHTAEQLAGGNLRSRANVEHRGDEIGALAASFDHMADRIEEAFAQRDEQDQRTRRFIADASHELRTPVTALKGYIDVLRRGAGRDPQALDAALEAMQREAERMRVLVLDLLTLARLDAQQRLNPEPVELNEALTALLDDGVPGLPPEVVRELSATPITAMCDRGALATMVRNIWVNACKYAPGARQTWSTGVEEARAVVRLHDDGPGIPAGDLPHVFERFYRGEKTRAREEGGSGLGLSIVRGLARAQGGDVTIDSAGGAGTTVTILLPLDAERTPPPAAPRHDLRPAEPLHAG